MRKRRALYPLPSIPERGEEPSFHEVSLACAWKAFDQEGLVVQDSSDGFTFDLFPDERLEGEYMWVPDR